jgi:hypothetical protein
MEECLAHEKKNEVFKLYESSDGKFRGTFEECEIYEKNVTLHEKGELYKSSDGKFEGTFAECDAYEKKTALYETKDGFRGSYDDCVAHENDPSLANPLVPTTATL